MSLLSQQRRFAGTVGAEHRDDLARGEIERDATDRVDAPVANVELT
jgi:hypothetical protein